MVVDWKRLAIGDRKGEDGSGCVGRLAVGGTKRRAAFHFICIGLQKVSMLRCVRGRTDLLYGRTRMKKNDGLDIALDPDARPASEPITTTCLHFVLLSDSRITNELEMQKPSPKGEVNNTSSLIHVFPKGDSAGFEPATFTRAQYKVSLPT
jgi:hypothetical protein